MGKEVIVLVLPLALLLLPLLFLRLHKKSQLFTERQGPIVSAEALDQLTLLFIIYFVLLLVPIAGRLTGEWGRPSSLLILFTILVSLLVRFKKLGDG